MGSTVGYDPFFLLGIVALYLVAETQMMANTDSNLNDNTGIPQSLSPNQESLFSLQCTVCTVQGQSIQRQFYLFPSNSGLFCACAVKLHTVSNLDDGTGIPYCLPLTQYYFDLQFPHLTYYNQHVIATLFWPLIPF